MRRATRARWLRRQSWFAAWAPSSSRLNDARSGPGDVEPPVVRSLVQERPRFAYGRKSACVLAHAIGGGICRQPATISCEYRRAFVGVTDDDKAASGVRSCLLILRR